MYKKSDFKEVPEEKIKDLFKPLLTSKVQEEKDTARVLEELLNTERLYVNDLRSLVGEYIIPLRRTVRRVKCKEFNAKSASTICEHSMIRSTCSKISSEHIPLLDAKSMKNIFTNVETLVKVNTELLGVLQTGLVGLKNPTLMNLIDVISKAFQRVMPFFKLYANYCHNYIQAVTMLQELRTSNSELGDFIAQKEKRSLATSLNSLLIKPVQRICKYPLLFAELLKVWLLTWFRIFHTLTTSIPIFSLLKLCILNFMSFILFHPTYLDLPSN